MRHLVKLLSAGIVVSTLTAFATAAAIPTDVLNVDFNVTNGSAGTYAGAAVVTGAGTTWNGLPIGNQLASVATYTSPTLVNSANTSTGIAALNPQVTLTNFRPYDAGAGTFAPALMNDIAAGAAADTPSSPSPIGFTITNLPNGVYDLYLYSQNGSNSNTGTLFIVDGIPLTATNTPSLSSFVEGANYVHYSGLTVTGGTLSGTAQTTLFTNAAAFNGFQLVSIPEVEVPEPASLSLLLLGILPRLRRRRPTSGCASR